MSEEERVYGCKEGLYKDENLCKCFLNVWGVIDYRNCNSCRINPINIRIESYKSLFKMNFNVSWVYMSFIYKLYML